MSDKVLTPELRWQIESDYTRVRTRQLALDPVRGKFDAAHLKEVNRRIFQDLPKAGFTDVTPGQFRAPTPGSNDWTKIRDLESVRVKSFVAYSPMDSASVSRLDAVLKNITPTEFSKLKPAEFTNKIGQLYVQLDYIHPFSDGNSRTLRVFTAQLAKESGYHIDWERFTKTPPGRDILYIARDISVNQIAVEHVRDFGTKRDIVSTTDQLGANRPLPDLLRDAVIPARAFAFSTLPREEALKMHPELAHAYRHLDQVAQRLKAQTPANAALLDAARKDVSQKLNRGEVKDLGGPVGISPAVAQTKQTELPGRGAPDRGRERE